MMRIKAMISAALTAALLLTSCGTGAARTQTAETVPVTPTVQEADFMGCFLGGDTSVNYLGMSLEEFNNATGNVYTEENALEYDKDFGYAKFSFGGLDGLFCGRAPFGKQMDVSFSITFKDDRIKEMRYIVEGDDDDPDKVVQAIADELRKDLPEGYFEEDDAPIMGKGSMRFAKDVDGYVFSVWKSKVGDSEYPVFFTFESYKDKYGME
ncbi:MAG: hypothetical protein II782_03930 [Oscillospiraceae bacterium]|nr:hypothetical protein [Oscillospiraceae bacterium]